MVLLRLDGSVMTLKLASILFSRVSGYLSVFHKWPLVWKFFPQELKPFF
jgi:hypothetical protein